MTNNFSDVNIFINAAGGGTDVNHLFAKINRWGDMVIVDNADVMSCWPCCWAYSLYIPK